MSRIKGANVLVTGGANGIGKLMGESCLLEGAAHLVIWDINDANLKNTIVEFSKKGFKNVTPYLVDVSDIDDIEKTATKVLLDVGNIDILFNNAGIVAGSKRFWEHTRNDIEKTMAINSNGVMHVARVFLPDMLKQGHGHVVNIASIAGIITNVNMAVYVGSFMDFSRVTIGDLSEIRAIAAAARLAAMLPAPTTTAPDPGLRCFFMLPELQRR